VVGIFFYVFTEQGLMSWLPSFYSQALNVPTTLALQVASLLALLLAIGRLFSVWILRFISWYPLVIICCTSIALLIAVGMFALNFHSAEIHTWRDLPLGALAFPLAGIFFAPLYPMMSSVILSSMPVNKHAPMTGLIMIFSVLGGTTGSFIIGRLFDTVGATLAYWIMPLSCAAMLVAFSMLNKKLK